MKTKILYVLLIILILSCQKKDEEEYRDIYGDIIYTDSFSPSQWEKPIARKRIKIEDKDIGEIIKQDSIYDKNRKIFYLINDFFGSLKNKDNEKIKTLLTPAAYNSYELRLPDINFNKEYTLRIAAPKTSKPDDTIASPGNKTIGRQTDNNISYDQNIFWLDFKLMFKTSSLISRFEIEFNSNECKISDFDNKFFVDIKNILTSDETDN